MALIVITIRDDASVGSDVGILCEPYFDTDNPDTPAQQLAMIMLNSVKAATEQDTVG